MNWEGEAKRKRRIPWQSVYCFYSVDNEMKARESSVMAIQEAVGGTSGPKKEVLRLSLPLLGTR